MAGAQPNRIRTSTLKSRIMNTAQTSVYQVKLQPPQEVISFLQSGSRGFNYSNSGLDVELMCKSVTLPGQSLFTHETVNDYRGVTEKMAYRKNYSEVNFTFMVNNSYDVVEMFDGWVDFVAGNEEDQSEYFSPAASYRMNYPNSYKTDVFITKFEKNAQLGGDINFSTRLINESSFLMEYALVGAFPLSINASTVSYEKSDVLTYDVSMAFTRYVRRRGRVS